MQLAKQTGNMKVGGDISSSNQFKIAMNAKMFDVLSNSMYEDKPGSIVREISSNALDGHTKAGCPEKPFTIHVPNAIEPWFSVKDEGVGMSDEDIQHVYSTYGESTKDQSNDEIGAFGLGSKTPFAYTDQFTVISINGGVKRTYVAIRGDDGLPSINLLDTCETDEHSGVEVSISIKKEDINIFSKKIIEQLKFFKVKPNLVNNLADFDFPDLTENVTYESDKVVVYSGVSHSWNGKTKDPVQGLWVVQGGVGYRLNIEHLGESLPNNVKSFAQALYKNNAYITFPIGDIAVTANREGISYEPHTIDAIVRRLTEISQDMTAEVVAKLTSQDSLWDRVITFNDQMDVMQHAITNLPQFGKLFDGAVLSNGKMVIAINPLNDAGYNAVWMTKYQYSPRGSYGFVTKVKRKVVGESQYSKTVTLKPIDDVRVFIRDTSSKPMARIQMLCDDEDYPSILMIESKMRSDITDKEINKIAKLLHINKAQIEKLSDLPAPKVTRTGSPSDKRPRAFQWNGSSNKNTSRDWTPVMDEIDDIEDAIYIPMERHVINTIVDGDNLSKKYMLLMHAKHIGMIDKPIIAVNMQTYNRILDGKIGAHHENWIDAVNALVDELMEKSVDFIAHCKYDAFHSVITRRSIINQIWQFDNTTVDMLNRIESVEKRNNMLKKRIGDDAKSLLKNFWSIITGDETRQMLNDATKAGETAANERMAGIMQKYPMLRYIGIYADKEELADAIEYIKLVDGA